HRQVRAHSPLRPLECTFEPPCASQRVKSRENGSENLALDTRDCQFCVQKGEWSMADSNRADALAGQADDSPFQGMSRDIFEFRSRTVVLSKSSVFSRRAASEICRPNG